MSSLRRPTPQIGIWWDDGEQIAAFAHPASENAMRIAGRFDSNLAHADEWPQAANRFGRSSDEEYFVVPRGRVLLDGRTGAGIIFHGNGTSSDRLQQIAVLFELSDWTAEHDSHYSIGSEADHLFDADEFEL